MSRLAKHPIKIPAKTEVTVREDRIVVKGPLGELSRPLRKEVSVSIVDGSVVLAPLGTSKFVGALSGTYAAHIKNMIKGVNTPYEEKLIIEGVGYRAEVSGTAMVFAIGLSHPVHLPIPEGIKVSVEKNVITILGSNKDVVGQFAATVRALKKPEPYKGKGIRYEKEVILRKAGKKAVA